MGEPAAMIRIALPTLLALLLPLAVHAQTPNADEFHKQLQTGKLKCALDQLIDIPAVWQMKPDALDSAFALPEGVTMEKSP